MFVFMYDRTIYDIKSVDGIIIYFLFYFLGVVDWGERGDWVKREGGGRQRL